MAVAVGTDTCCRGVARFTKRSVDAHQSGQLSSDRPFESNSHKTYDFFARKRRAVKGMAISDKSGGLRQNWVVC